MIVASAIQLELLLPEMWSWDKALDNTNSVNIVAYPASYMLRVPI